MSTTFHIDAAGYWIEKDPQAVLDYAMDWSDWLATDTITGTPVWTVPTGLTKDSQSNTTTVATAWLSGGVLGTTYTVSCKITTTAGRTDERSFRLKIVER
jgi:hypothetical protein